MQYNEIYIKQTVSWFNTSKGIGRFVPIPFCPTSFHPRLLIAFKKCNMENTIANIRILNVVRLVHGYFILIN